MNAKIARAHGNIDGLTVAQIITDFQREFRDVYPASVLASSLGAVGPVQSLIGFAIEKGYLCLPDVKADSDDIYYVLFNGAAYFVKEAEFFKEQGGLTQKWGQAWRPVVADSIEDARAKAAKLDWR